MIYVPQYNNSMCIEVIDSNTLRVFDNEYTNDYTDYYINSNYIYKKGTIENSYIKNCSDMSFSSSSLYRQDLPQIFFISLCFLLLFVPFYIIYKQFRKR